VMWTSWAASPVLGQPACRLTANDFNISYVCCILWCDNAKSPFMQDIIYLFFKPCYNGAGTSSTHLSQNGSLLPPMATWLAD